MWSADRTHRRAGDLGRPRPRASTPRSSPKNAEYSCTLTGSSPAQFTMVAGHAGGVEQRFEVRADVVVVDRAVGHRVPAGVHRLAGRDGVEVPDRQPALVAVRRAHPGDGRRAGRTTARSSGPRPPRRSCETEYGADGGAIASPSGSSSRNACHGSGCGLYTVTVDITSAALALRQCSSTNPVPSALTRSARS